MWLHLGSTQNSDWMALQEVKTTSDASLSLANDLTKDYQKLFAQSGRFTLQTRLNALKNKLEEFGLGHHASRGSAFGALNARQANGIYLVPTLVHDRAKWRYDQIGSCSPNIVGSRLVY